MNKIEMEHELQKLGSSYSEIINELKKKFKDREFDVTQENISINISGDALDVTAIAIDSDYNEITVVYKYDKNLDLFVNEIDLSCLKFFDQISILKSLIEKIEDNKTTPSEETVSEWR